MAKPEYQCEERQGFPGERQNLFLNNNKSPQGAFIPKQMKYDPGLE